MTTDEIRLRLYKHFLRLNPDITLRTLEVLVQDTIRRRKEDNERQQRNTGR